MMVRIIIGCCFMFLAYHLGRIVQAIRINRAWQDLDRSLDKLEKQLKMMTKDKE